jgi:NAD(P)-dependent dehydrogenase (short-subunit alcohol dehydrogenase family)
MGKLTGKTALVVGGGPGIGQAVAYLLAAEGCRVAIAGRREDVLRTAAAQWSGEPKILVHAVDVADLESVKSLVTWAERELGGVNTLVNCAGINIRNRSMAALSPQDWEMVLKINATGAFYLMHELLPHMRSRRDGLIVNVSSIAGKRASVLGGVAYSAAKFALTALGTTSGLEENAHGIRISNVYPGEVNTPILDQRPVPVSEEHRRRILQPSDVAEAILMIACLPPNAHVPELVIKPTHQAYA